MELASVLAGEQWSDHPACTHPLLAQLARGVNDYTSDDSRQDLLVLIPSVVGRNGDERSWLTISVAVASSTILDVPEPTQRVLAGGLLQAEQLCADAGPAMAATRHEAREALLLVPMAVKAVEALGVRERITLKTFAKHCAPTMLRCTIEGIVAAGNPDRDQRLRAVLEAGIAVCPAPTPASPRVDSHKLVR
jgi:hypothetical protein